MGKGISSVVISIIMVVIILVVVVSAYMFISSYLGIVQEGIEIMDTFCDNGVVSVMVRNIGEQTITDIEVIQESPVDDSAEDWVGTLNPGNTMKYTDLCFGTESRLCTYIMRPSGGNGRRVNVKCFLSSPMANQEICQNAENGGLCDGLDIVYGAGYRAACCSEYSLCC